jgi:chromosome segregation ATPase
VTGTQLLIMLGFLALVTLQVVSLFGGLSGGSSGSPDSTVQNNIITHIEQEHRKMQQAIAQLADDQKSESANLRSRLDAFDDWHQRQATDLGQLRGKLDELKEQAKGYEGNLSTLIKKADDEFGADQEKARAALQGAIDQISKSVAEVGQKLGKLNDGSKSTVEELRGLREEITKLTVDLNAVRKQVKELSDKVNRS